MANQYDPIVIKSGLAGVLGTDTLRADLNAHAGLTTTGLVSGDVVQVTANLTLSKASHLLTSPIVGVYDGVSGSVVREGIVVATFETAPTANGVAVYLSSTAGKLTTTKPTKDMLHEVGVVVDYTNRKILLQQKPVIALPASPPLSLFIGRGYVNYPQQRSTPAFSSLGDISGPAARNYGSFWDGNYVWFLNDSATPAVMKTDPITRTVIGGPWTIAGSNPGTESQSGIAFDGTNGWLSNKVSLTSGPIYKFNLSDGSYVSVESLYMPRWVTYDGAGHILVTSAGTATLRVYKVDIATGSTVATWTKSVGGASLNGGGAVAGDYFWQGVYVSGVPSHGYLVKIRISDMAEVGYYDAGCAGIAWTIFDGTWLWSKSVDDFVKHDLTGALLGSWYRRPAVAAFDGTYIWVGNTTSNFVYRFARDGSDTSFAFNYPFGICCTKRVLPWPVD